MALIFETSPGFHTPDIDQERPTPYAEQLQIAHRLLDYVIRTDADPGTVDRLNVRDIYDATGRAATLYSRPERPADLAGLHTFDTTVIAYGRGFRAAHLVPMAKPLPRGIGSLERRAQQQQLVDEDREIQELLRGTWQAAMFHAAEYTPVVAGQLDEIQAEHFLDALGTDVRDPLKLEAQIAQLYEETVMGTAASSRNLALFQLHRAVAYVTNHGTPHLRDLHERSLALAAIHESKL